MNRNDLPGRRYVAVQFACDACQKVGTFTRLALIGRDVYPGASSELWQEGWKKGGETVHSKWTADDTEVLLWCFRCQTYKAVHRAWIEAYLADADVPESGRHVEDVFV